MDKQKSLVISNQAFLFTPCLLNFCGSLILIPRALYIR